MINNCDRKIKLNLFKLNIIKLHIIKLKLILILISTLDKSYHMIFGIVLVLFVNFISLIILPFNTIANAYVGGDSIGNGGVLWVCRSLTGGKEIHSGILADLFEANLQYELEIISQDEFLHKDPFDIYNERKKWFQQELPEFFNLIQPRFEYVETHLQFINAELLSTNDFSMAIKPEASSCSQGQWETLNIANFREDDQKILISSSLWNNSKIGNLDKAALLFHEAIYYWMRSYYGATTSDKSRRLTGILFSKLNTEQMKNEIRKVLGEYPDQPEGSILCVMKNTKKNQVFVAYEQTLFEAQFQVRNRCQSESDPQWCERSSVECDEIINQSSKKHHCISENSVSRKIFRGLGRNILEAQFNAHMSCFMSHLNDSKALHECPDFAFMECY